MGKEWKQKNKKNSGFWQWGSLNAGGVALAIISGLVGSFVDIPQTFGLQNGKYAQAPAPPPRELVIDKTANFTGWASTGQENDLLFIAGVLSLNPLSYNKVTGRRNTNPHEDPQGYKESPVTIAENSFVCMNFVPNTTAVDLTFRSRNSFQITIGDGDNSSIRVKQYNSSNTNWDYVLPDEEFLPFVDESDRYQLEQPLPIGQDTTACLTINSEPGATTKKVTAELSIFTSDGPLTMTRKPSWTMQSSNQRNNNSTNFSIGLIDSRADHPRLLFRSYCAVEMQGAAPDSQERNACQNP